MKYARMFEHLGFNAVVYDHRRHGESEGKTTSYGHYEKLDLQKVVQAIREEIGERDLEQQVNVAELFITGKVKGRTSNRHVLITQI